MNKRFLLEISIPTYNRTKALERTLLLIKPQLTKDVALRVIDNASSEPVEKMINRIFQYEENVIYQRNRVNIGAAGNILRCFENSEGHWLYVLGDDDLPHDNLIKTLLDFAKNDPGFAQANFGSFFQRSVAFKTEGVLDLFQKLDSYPNLNYISANLYKTEEFLPILRYGYQFSYSMSPHMALTISVAAKGQKVWFSDKTIISRPEVPLDQQWSYAQFGLCQPILLEHPDLDDQTKIEYSKKLQDSAKVLEKITINYLLLSQDINNSRGAIYLYKQFLRRWFYARRDPGQQLKIWIYQILFFCPVLSFEVIMFFLRIAGKKNKVDEYRVFVGRDNRI